MQSFPQSPGRPGGHLAKLKVAGFGAIPLRITIGARSSATSQTPPATHMYRKQVRRRRAVLIGLIVLGFVLLIHLRQRFGRSGRRARDLSPGHQRRLGALKPARDLINWFDETMDARGERDRLQSELEEARAKAVAGEVALEDNRQLRKMVGLAEAGKIPTPTTR